MKTNKIEINYTEHKMIAMAMVIYHSLQQEPHVEDQDRFNRASESLLIKMKAATNMDDKTASISIDLDHDEMTAITDAMIQLILFLLRPENESFAIKLSDDVHNASVSLIAKFKALEWDEKND